MGNWLTKTRDWMRATHAKLKGFRTILLAGAMLTVDVLDTADLTTVIPPAWQPYWLIAHPIIFGWMRMISKTPVGT